MHSAFHIVVLYVNTPRLPQAVANVSEAMAYDPAFGFWHPETLSPGVGFPCGPKAAADYSCFGSSEVDLYQDAYRASPTKGGLQDSATKLESLQKQDSPRGILTIDHCFLTPL